MPKGSKICPHCGGVVGPRAYQCPHCFKGFLVKGVQYPDGEATTKSPSKIPGQLSLTIQVEEYNDPKELARQRRHYMPDPRSWISKCGNYLIRYYTHFMDVDLHDEKSYRLYIKKRDTWMPFPNGEDNGFRSLNNAIKAIVAHRKSLQAA